MRRYSGEKKSDAFLRFMQEKAGVWVGLPGQIKEFDALIKQFLKATDKAPVLERAAAAASAVSIKDADGAKYYLKVPLVSRVALHLLLWHSFMLLLPVRSSLTSSVAHLACL